MRGRPGGGRPRGAEKRISHARDQIDALGGERRREALAGGVKLRQKRALFDRGVLCAGAVSERVGHDDGLIRVPAAS